VLEIIIQSCSSSPVIHIAQQAHIPVTVSVPSIPLSSI
jgi:hypothetical protein